MATRVVEGDVPVARCCKSGDTADCECFVVVAVIYNIAIVGRSVVGHIQRGRCYAEQLNIAGGGVCLAGIIGDSCGQCSCPHVDRGAGGHGDRCTAGIALSIHYPASDRVVCGQC